MNVSETKCLRLVLVEILMGEHTPTPWVSPNEPDGSPAIFFSDGDPFMAVGECITHSMIGLEQARANASFIVRACNSHAELVKALEVTHAVLSSLKPDALGVEGSKEGTNYYRAEYLIKLIEGALEKARGEGQ
jgi:3-methyladenine DNA glycosylase/8-oxoguanine DNA glycosylase